MKSKQVLDVQQMQHLQELGLELKETMLYWARCVDNNPRAATHYGKWVLIKGNSAQTVGLMHWEFIPAYTLQDVLGALPIEIKYRYKRCWLCIELADEMIGYYYENARFEHRWVYYEVVMIDESLIDAGYKLLCWAIENKFVETNKNE